MFIWKFLCFALLLSGGLVVFAQNAPTQEKPQPDRWRGLIIDETTPEQALEKLGVPKKDKEESVRTYPLNERLILDHNTKGIRRLSYEKLPGVEKVNLYFKENKLVVIEIDPQDKLAATTLANAYELEFVPKISRASLGTVERNQGREYPINYPSYYHLLAMNEKVYVSAGVNNSSMGALLLGSSRGNAGPGDKGGFPGKVEKIQIISRTLEKREGMDALK